MDKVPYEDKKIAVLSTVCNAHWRASVVREFRSKKKKRHFSIFVICFLSRLSLGCPVTRFSWRDDETVFFSFYHFKLKYFSYCLSRSRATGFELRSLYCCVMHRERAAGPPTVPRPREIFLFSSVQLATFRTTDRLFFVSSLSMLSLLRVCRFWWMDNSIQLNWLLTHLNIFVSFFVKTKGKNLGARYWTLFVGLVSRERHPSRFFGCYLFKSTKESRKYRHSSENSASDEDGWSNRFPMTSLRADVHHFQSILYRIRLAKEFEWRWRRR
jgi:hypothetical protein